MSWYSLLSLLVGLVFVLAGLSAAVESRPSNSPVPPAPPAAAPPMMDERTAESLSAHSQVASLAEGEQARRNGDFQAAAGVLRLVASNADRASSNEALLQLGVVLLEAGRAFEALEVTSELLGRDLDHLDRAAGLLVRGRAQRAAGGCDGALESFTQAQRLGPDLAPYPDILAAECFSLLGDRNGQADRAERAAAAALSRLSRIDALEYRADAALKRGQREAALATSEQLLANAGTRAYRAQTLASLANINLDLGRRDAAALALATVAVELPETPMAIPCLDKLAEIGGLDLVATDRAGLVLHFGGRHADAVSALRTARGQGLPPDRAATAQFYEGLSLLQLDRFADGVEALRGVVSTAPDSEFAALGLLRAGRALERAGSLVGASDRYQEGALRFIGSPAGQEAGARLVISLARRGAYPEAVAAGRTLGETNADARWRGLGIFWAGKALAMAGDAAQADAAWRQAADLDPDDFGGLRAGAVLDGDRRTAHVPRRLDLSRLEPTDADREDMHQWLARLGVRAVDLDQQLTADRNVALAHHLYRVGMREQAGWELQEVADRRANDPAALAWLARFASDRGEASRGIRFAVEARKAAGERLSDLPRVVQRLIFPLPYSEIIVSNAEARGVDPLLFAALVRQESGFNPLARSSADAMGLTQVIPSTGQGIARALGRADFKNEDLLRPIVSVEFGLYYLSRQLQQYGGQIYPALAAYNAGGAAANRWLSEIGSDDMDLFAERIPYSETNHYVHVVYEYYRLYLRLYGT